MYIDKENPCYNLQSGHRRGMTEKHDSHNQPWTIQNISRNELGMSQSVSTCFRMVTEDFQKSWRIIDFWMRNESASHPSPLFHKRAPLFQRRAPSWVVLNVWCFIMRMFSIAVALSAWRWFSCYVLTIVFVTAVVIVFFIVTGFVVYALCLVSVIAAAHCVVVVMCWAKLSFVSYVPSLSEPLSCCRGS